MSLSTRCALYYAAYYGLMYPSMVMFSTYMVSMGYPLSMVAMMYTVSGITSVLVKPLFSPVMEKGKCHLLSLCLLAAMAVGAGVFFFYPGQAVWKPAVYALLTIAGNSAMNELGDTWVLKLAKQTGEVDYGKVRSFGSASFALTGLCYGFLLARFGMGLAPWVLFLYLLFLATAVALLPNPKSGVVEHVSLTQPLGLLKNRRFLLFVIFYGIVYATFGFTDNYIPVLILERGGTTAHTGFNDFMMAGIEFFMLRQFSRIANRLGTDTVVWVGMLGFALKAFLASVMPTPVGIILGCLTQFVSFCFFIPSKMRFLEEEVEQDQIAGAMTLSNLFSSFYSTIVSNTFTSLTIERLGTASTMRIYALVSALCGVLFALLIPKAKSGKAEQ